jgi:hypothetical protein
MCRCCCRPLDTQRIAGADYPQAIVSELASPDFRAILYFSSTLNGDAAAGSKDPTTARVEFRLLFADCIKELPYQAAWLLPLPG